MIITNKKISYLLFITSMTLPYSYKLSTLFVIIFSITSIIWNRKIFKVKNIFFDNNLIKSPLIIFLLPLLGLIFTDFSSDTIREIIKYLPFPIVSIAYANSTSELKKYCRLQLQNGLIVGTTLLLLFLFTNTLFGIWENNDPIIRLFSHKYSYLNFISPIDSHPTYLGFLIILSNFFIYTSKRNKKIIIIILMINILGLLFIMSKIIIIIFISQIILLLLSIKNTKIKILLVSILLIVVCLTTFLYNKKLKDIYFLQRFSIELLWDINTKNTNSSINGRVKDDSRLARWNAIYNETKKSLILGHGSGSEKSILNKAYLKNNLQISLKRKYNTHNQYLFFLVEYGILGLLVFFIFLFFNLYVAYKQKDFFIVWFIIWLMLICCFENYLNRTMGVILISLALTYLKINNEKNCINI